MGQRDGIQKNKEGIRKDPYYTDPVSQYVFRTLKAARSFLATGKVTKRQFIQRTSVHDLYSFEKSADLHESLHKRLTNNWKDAKTRASSPKPRGSAQREKINCNGQTSYSTEDRDTNSDTTTGSVSPNEHPNIKNKTMKTQTGQSSYFKTIKRPRGRLLKTNGWTTTKARTKREAKQHTN